MFLLTLLVATAMATPPPIEQEVVFRNGATTLSATLLTPGTPGPHPAVLFAHGSGAGPRAQLRPFADRFVKLGLVALVWDKRTNWYDASLDDLADDAIAAAVYLKSRPDVDPKRVGVWGISQAGWVIPRAVAHAPDAFSFAVIVTGGALKPIEVERFDYAAALDRIGATPDQKREGLTFVERYFDYLRSGEDRPGLEQAIVEARERPWFKAVDVSRIIPTEAARKKWEWVATYDPMPEIQGLRMPILVVLGGQDRPALNKVAVEQWRSGLAANHDATVLEFLAAGHGVTIGGMHHPGGGPQVYAPGYLEMVDGWLAAWLAAWIAAHALHTAP